jgi:anti-sigma factor RsiW
MTTNAINCEIFSDRLMAYLEHEIDDAARASLERHALSCDDCGALLADLRKLRVDAANLAELAPSRDLWTGIAARIEAPVVSIGRTAMNVAPSGRVRRWMSSIAIAASLVAAAGVGYFAASNGRVVVPVPSTVAELPDSIMNPIVVTGIDSTPAPRAPSVSVPQQSPATNVAIATPAPENQAVGAQLAVATLTADYNREVVRLRGLIEERRNQLDPVTVAIIEKNLQVIDAAIAECQRAITRDPSSRFLIESLNQSLQTKVELMRTAALLPSRT